MQSILNIKLKMEGLAKQEFSVARAKLDTEEERLDGIIMRKEGYEKKAKELLSGTLDLRDIEENRMAISCMESAAETQRQAVAAAERELEAAREKLTDVMRERKTHETLKEKAFNLFLEEEKRQESKVVDELTSYKHGQRKKTEDTDFWSDSEDGGMKGNNTRK
jgi:flagellar FliJ protein